MARIALLALALVASASASLVPVVRQPVTADDVIGTFRIASSLVGPECPRLITHTDTVAEDETTLSHDVMTINGNDCTDGGEMTIFDDPASLKNEIDDQTTKDFLEDFEDTGVAFIYGLEKEGRKCGGGTRLVLKPQTVVLIFNPENDVSPGGNFFESGKVYMVVIEPESGICSYVKREDVPSPEPVPPGPAPGPAPPASESPEVPVPSESPEPDNSGGPGSSRPPPGGIGPGTGSNNTDPEMDESPDESAEEGDGPDASESLESSPGEDDDPDDDSVCFPADASVELENGSFKTMAQVELGDRVKVADGSFSDVFMFTHKDASAVHDFVRISTRSGASLSATRGHYIYVNNAFAAAGSAKVGDTLELGDGSKTLVSNVAIVKGTGLFNPQTVHGDIIVNSVRASTFTRTIEPSTAQAMLAPLRMLYDTFGISAAFLNNGADSIASVLPKGQVAL